MAKHYNPSITERARRILNSKVGDFLPDNVQGPVATIEIGQVTKQIFRSTTAATILTVPDGKCFYVTAAHISASKAAGDSGSALFISASGFDGGTLNILDVIGITLTAERLDVALPFPVPIRLEPGAVVSTSATGTWTARMYKIYGYFEETV